MYIIYVIYKDRRKYTFYLYQGEQGIGHNSPIPYPLFNCILEGGEIMNILDILSIPPEDLAYPRYESITVEGFPSRNTKVYNNARLIPAGKLYIPKPYEKAITLSDGRKIIIRK